MALKKCGGVSELVTLLRMLVTMPQKHQLIAELASNIGQLCNEEDWRTGSGFAGCEV